MGNDNDILSALFGGAGLNNTTPDISAFQKTLQANDILSMASAPILGAKFDTSTWSPSTTLGVTAAQSFLGSLMNGIANRNQGEQLAKVAQVLPQLYRDPMSVGVPEGVDSEAFGGLKLSAMSKMFNTDEDIRQVLGQKGVNVNPDGSISQMKSSSPIDAIFGTDNKKKLVKDLEDTTYNRITGLPSYKLLSDVESNFKALPELAKQDTKASDIGLISTISRIRDPNSTVREGEYAINSDTQSYLDSIAGKWRGVVKGDTRFTQEDKNKIIASVVPKYNELVNAYAAERNPLIEALVKQGGDPSNVPTRKYDPFDLDSLTGGKKDKVLLEGKINTANVGGITPTKEQARAEARRRGLIK